VAQAAGQAVRDASPFSAIEVQFPECDKSPDLPEWQAHIGPGVLAVQETDDRRILFTSLVMSVFDYCGHVSFHIHVKLRLMVGVSAVSCCLEFIPFLPLVALLVSLYLLCRAWIPVDKVVKVDQEGPNVRPLTKAGNFLKAWFEWLNPEKSLFLLRISAVFLARAVFPRRVYYPALIAAYIFGFVVQLYQKRVFHRLVDGFWLCTRDPG
jgi:hypothetical protein